jgi:glycosyltransferase involved in cell wall biosynthesis
MKLISCVIPCYNHGAYLEEAVESVLAQSYSNLEIVIVNDGSTEPYTIDVLSSFDRPRCRVIHTENKGLPAARNNGIKHTSGEYICCLDADDRYHPEYFKKAAEILNQDIGQRYGAVPAWVRFFGSRDTVWKTIGSNNKGFTPYLQGIRNNIQSATLFRRICWEKAGGFDESMTLGYEDWDFWLRMLDLGYEWYCLEEVLIYYRQKDQSMVTQADALRSLILKKMIEKNNHFYAKHLVSIVLELDNEITRLKTENSRLLQQLSPPDSTIKSDQNSSATVLRRIFSKIFQKFSVFIL